MLRVCCDVMRSYKNVSNGNMSYKHGIATRFRYFKAYIGCYEGLVERQADADLQTYQFKMLKSFYDPVLKTCDCTIGRWPHTNCLFLFSEIFLKGYYNLIDFLEKGTPKMLISAIAVASTILLFIVCLAAFCGCRDYCGEALKGSCLDCRKKEQTYQEAPAIEMRA